MFLFTYTFFFVTDRDDTDSRVYNSSTDVEIVRDLPGVQMLTDIVVEFSAGATRGAHAFRTPTCLLS